MTLIQCDVCDAIISESHCQECGFDNSYQFQDRDMVYDEIVCFLESYTALDEENIIITLAERFGMPEQELIIMLENYEEDINFHIEDSGI